MKIEFTFSIQGETEEDYLKIIDYFQTHDHENLGWELQKYPLLKKIVANKTEIVERI